MAWTDYTIQNPKYITPDLQGYSAETNAFGIGPQRFYIAANKSGQNRLLTYDWLGRYIETESFDIADTTQNPSALRRAYGNLYIVLNVPSGNQYVPLDSYVYPYSLGGIVGSRINLGGLRVTCFETAPPDGFYAFKFPQNNPNYIIHKTDGTQGNLLRPGSITQALAVCQTASEFLFLGTDGAITATDLNFSTKAGDSGNLDSDNSQPRAIDHYQGLVAVYDARGRIYLYGDFPETPEPLPPVRQIKTLNRFLKPYDVIRFGSNRAVSEIRKLHGLMIEQSAVDQLQFRSNPTIKQQLETVELTPEWTIPGAQVGDAVFVSRVPADQIDDEGEVRSTFTYPTHVPAGIPYFEIEGFKDTAGNQGQSIIATQKITE